MTKKEVIKYLNKDIEEEEFDGYIFIGYDKKVGGIRLLRNNIDKIGAYGFLEFAKLKLE